MEQYKEYKFCGSIEDKEDYMKLTEKYFLKKWNDGGGFFKLLCDAITASDYENMDKLYESYPELVDGYFMYHLGALYEDASSHRVKPNGHLNEYTKVQLKKLEREVSASVGFPITIAEVGEGLITAYWCPGEIAIILEVNVLTKEELIDLLIWIIDRWENAPEGESLAGTLVIIEQMYNQFNKKICDKYKCYNTRSLAFNIGWETGM